MVCRTPPGSGFSIRHINYQLLQFAAPAAALRTSRAIIGLNLIEYISDDLFQYSKDNKEGHPKVSFSSDIYAKLLLRFKLFNSSVEVFYC